MHCNRRGLWRAAWLLAGPSVQSILAVQARAQPAFEEVLAGARRERDLEIWLGSPPASAVQRALLEAFQRRFGFEVRWKWVTLHSARANARLLAEASVGRVSADVLAASADNLGELANRGLVRPYPWETVFEATLPRLGEPVRRVMPELQGMGLLWFDAVYVVAWNVHFVREADTPRRFRDFMDPRWRGRFAMNVLAGAPFDLLSLDLGETATLDLVRGLLANQPILKAGTPSVGSAITTGEAHLGIGAYSTVERARRNGEPQAYRFFEDYLPVLPLHVCVPEKAPHPNMARLFTAWLVTEGARLAEELDVLSRISDPGSALARAVKALPPTTRIVEERSLADVAKTRAMVPLLTALFTH